MKEHIFPLNSDNLTSLVDILRQRTQEQPSKSIYTFLVNGETEELTLTYQELDQKAQAIAAVLQSFKAKGERALLLYPPGLEFIKAFFGCLYAGVIAVPAYPPRRNQKMNRLLAIAENAQAKFLLATTSVIDNLNISCQQEPELAALHWIATDNIELQQSLDWTPIEINKKSLAFLQYTSGSTGKPKGVIVSHGNILQNEEMIQKGFQHTASSIVVGWLPLFHDMGLIGNILQPLYLGIPSYLMSPVDFLQKPVRWLKAISHYKGSTSGGPDFAYKLCVDKITTEQKENIDLNSWKVAFNGAEPIRSETLERFCETFKACGFHSEAFYPCYGMAEATLFISGRWQTEKAVVHLVDGKALEKNLVVETTEDNQDARKVVSCGQTLLDGKIIIVDPESLQELASDQVGEIWVSGTHIAQGYWNKPQETEETFNAYLKDTDEGPFLRTGDLGFLHNGELFITGRQKDLIIISGRNHYPQDIEMTVEKSHPALRPNCGAAFTLEIKGQERLVIVQEVERTYLHSLNVDETVISICCAVSNEYGLAVYAVVLLKTGSIPKTSSGKIQRHACKAGFLAGSLDVVNDWRQKF